MKQRFDKRKMDRQVANMAQNLTGEYMFMEYTDMIEENRERTQERLDWLVETAPQQALNRFNYSGKVPEATVARFLREAKKTAKNYLVHVILKMEKELTIAKEKAESGA